MAFVKKLQEEKKMSTQNVMEELETVRSELAQMAKKNITISTFVKGLSAVGGTSNGVLKNTTLRVNDLRRLLGESLVKDA